MYVHPFSKHHYVQNNVLMLLEYFPSRKYASKQSPSFPIQMARQLVEKSFDVFSAAADNNRKEKWLNLILFFDLHRKESFGKNRHL